MAYEYTSLCLLEAQYRFTFVMMKLVNNSTKTLFFSVCFCNIQFSKNLFRKSYGDRIYIKDMSNEDRSIYVLHKYIYCTVYDVEIRNNDEHWQNFPRF